MILISKLVYRELLLFQKIEETFDLQLTYSNINFSFVDRVKEEKNQYSGFCAVGN